MRNNFTCYVIGVDSLLIRCSEILLEKGNKILGVISSAPNIKNWAFEKGIKVIEHDNNLFESIKNDSFDYLFSITNLEILPDDLINLPKVCSINFHDGPLPKYAGINATTWAIMNGEKNYGITWHEITTEIDKGDILKQQFFEIEEGETALSLNAKCFEAAANAFEELVEDLNTGNVNRLKQKLEERSYFGKYKRPENASLINWSRSADEIYAFVRSLNFGRYSNPLGMPKIKLEDKYYVVTEVEVTNQKSSSAPGTITSLSDGKITISTQSTDINIKTIFTINGLPASVKDLISQHNLISGYYLNGLDDETAKNITSVNTAAAKKEKFWVKRLREIEGIDLHYAKKEKVVQEISMPSEETIELPVSVIDKLISENIDSSVFLAAAFSIFIGRHSGKDNYSIGLINQQLMNELKNTGNLFADCLPVNISFNPDENFSSSVNPVSEQIETCLKSKTYVRDIFARYPELHSYIDKATEPSYPVCIGLFDDASGITPHSGNILTLIISSDLSRVKLVYDSSSINDENIKLLKNQFLNFLELSIQNPNSKTGIIPIISQHEKKKLLTEWNNTETEYPIERCIHTLFEEQVLRSPDAVAVYCKGSSLTYRELDNRSNKLAQKLQHFGVGPDVLVGISLHRSLEMMVAILAVLKAGGAYVPLDPDFPKDRILYMISDSQCPVIITEQKLTKELGKVAAKIISIDSDWNAISREKSTPVESDVKPDNLSYVIYTSGSTGKPKGVMVQHKNVVNFFTGMDKHIGFNPPGVWLAVTSLSFDISVLELLWTLTRGFKVVIYAEEDWKTEKILSATNGINKKIDFSLFYFSSYASENPEGKYDLLLEGAKFADQNRFAAVWTPERHFHDFGGLYPNPAVTGAGIATVTKHVRIMSGSCVSPLHSPIRIAEDWSVVDNLSNGRVGISFAAGWQPNDFAIMPQNYDRRKDIMFEQIEVVRKLWRGEAVQFQAPNGKTVDIKTLPRPIQKDLPVWITAANNPETFRMAGERGFNLLTHLLGQTVDDLKEKIDVYKKAWKESGHEGEGYVSLMLHTFVGENIDEVREIVREPMKQYLNSAVSLVQLASWYFPTYDKLDSSFDQAASQLSPADMDAILNHAFERYFETSALLGTPETCLKMVENLKHAGVNDIACLIDFGVDSELVLSHLQYLNAVKTLANLGVREQQKKSDENGYSIPELMSTQKVSHLQCTPSMAKMLLMNEDAKKQLKSLDYMMIGGEAFPVSLAKQLSEIVSGNILNMYGPTETTIWSSVYKLENINNAIPIGRPIANTKILLLDKMNQLVPIGVPGELCIGGDGVVRGYLGRPELTTERFIANPFSTNRKNGRIYKTGDLACYRPDGVIEFLGRLDHQVKIRGYRIELGEIETALERNNNIREAVVIAREDTPGDKRLVAYLVSNNRSKISTVELRSFLKDFLPDYMIPSLFVYLDAFPLTPNGKVDRKALPLPESDRPELDKEFIAPSTPTEKTLAEIWSQVLGIENIGIYDNFFDLGGHSLSAVQVTVKVHQAFNVNLSLQTFFQSATLEKLARAIDEKLLELVENDQLEKLLNEVEQDPDLT